MFTARLPRRELPFRKRVRTCPESAGCRADVDPRRLVWAFPWRYPLHRRIQRDPAFTGFLSDPSGPSFHVITLVSGRNTGSSLFPLDSAQGSTTIVPVGSWRADTGKVPA